MKDQNCLNCHFFYQTNQREGKAIGYCRANPPQPFYESTLDGHMEPKIGRFPLVLGTLWCGMWDMKDEEEATQEFPK